MGPSLAVTAHHPSNDRIYIDIELPHVVAKSNPWLVLCEAHEIMIRLSPCQAELQSLQEAIQKANERLQQVQSHKHEKLQARHGTTRHVV